MPFAVRVDQTRELEPGSELLLRCFVDHSRHNRDGTFEVCTLLGEVVVHTLWHGVL